MLSIFFFILGLVVGSFLNVLIDRLPNEESIMGRSRCDHCHTSLAWNDLIPVISYISLRGRCRYCKKRFSWQYPFIEMLTGGAFLLISSIQYPISGQITNYQSPITNNFYFISLVGIASVSIVIFFSDLKYHIIPDSMQVFLFVFAFLYLLAVGLTPQSFFDHVIGSFVVMLPILFLFLITKGRGMGFGDVKLAFSIGFLLAPFAGLIALYIAFISGAIVGVIFIVLRKKKLKSKLAFGPFLLIGLWVMLVWGELIIILVKKIYRME